MLKNILYLFLEKRELTNLSDGLYSPHGHTKIMVEERLRSPGIFKAALSYDTFAKQGTKAEGSLKQVVKACLVTCHSLSKPFAGVIHMTVCLKVSQGLGEANIQVPQTKTMYHIY